MSSLKSWFKGLKGKLLVTACLPVVGFAIVTYIAHGALESIGGMLSESYEDVVPAMDHLGRMTTMRASIGYFCWAAIGSTDAKKKNEFLDKAQNALEEFVNVAKKYEATPFSEEEEKNYTYVREHKEEFIKLSTEMITKLRGDNADDQARARSLIDYGPWHKMAIEIRKTVEANIRMYQDQAAKMTLEQKQERARANQLLLVVSLIAVVSLFSLIMIIATRVSRTIEGTAGLLQETGEQINTAISQLSLAGTALSNSSTEAAASLEETVASLEELTSMVKLSSDHAREASGLSKTATSNAETGETEIKTLIHSMNEISDSSKKIVDIINVIDDIAFQTNLLALNAAVEAARAGEQGKGFAVVADAVRTLAQKSAEAAKDIAKMIQESVDRIDRGTEVAGKSGIVLANIVTSVKKVSDLNHEISSATEEQSGGIAQINKAMNQLDQSSQSNAASSEEIAASAEEISSQAKHMQKAVIKLNEVIKGAA